MKRCAWLLLSFSSLAAAENWPSFRGPGAAGIGDGPAPWVWDVARGTNVKWRTTIPGLGHSSPVIWEDKVFVTSAVSTVNPEYPVGLNEDLRSSSDLSEQAWNVYCVDLRSGVVRWQRTLATGVPRTQRHRKNSYATPTPVTDGRHLIVFFGSEGLFALTLEGELLWKRDLGVLKAGFHDGAFQWGVASSPVLYKDLVIVQADVDKEPFLAAFDLRTGERAWSVPRADGNSWSSPSVYLGQPSDLVVTNTPRTVRAYDPATGLERWRYHWNQDVAQSTPVVANGMIFASSGKGQTQPILAIRPGARGDITLSPDEASSLAVAWSRSQGGSIVTSPLVYGDYLYVLVDIGVLRCFSASDGALVYQQRIQDSFLSSPVAADGKVYLTSETGEVYVVKAGPRFEVLAVNPMGEPCVATPAFSAGMLIVRTALALYGIQDVPAKGEPRR